MPRPTAREFMAVELSADEARRFALAAQHLVGSPDRRAGVAGLLGSLRAVQLDTISVLARSHELVPYARLGAVGRPKIDAAYWGGDAFEYWAHAACVMPMSQWPLFAFRRRRFLGRSKEWGQHSGAPSKAVLARVRAEGPMTATDLGGAKKSAQWWGWSEVKRSAEFLLATGQLVCTRRVGWRRIYDLPERAIPADVLHDDLDDDQCQVALIQLAAGCLGVATGSDLADYFRLKKLDVARLLPQTGLVPVAVRGWAAPAWAQADTLDRGLPRGRHRTTLLSPFDSLVWDRARTARIFGLDHRLEAYVPKPLRQHGYFSMPVLAGGQLIARVDPARVAGTLTARQVTVIPEHATAARLPATSVAIRDALSEAAAWVGCSAIAIERVTPESAVDRVRLAVA
ncbi:MAG TPA: crosslink repair DNA glycosylase YcaQ family protein [Acidothermaceae bacterium]